MSFHDELNEIRSRAGLPIVESQSLLYHGTSLAEFEKLKKSRYNAFDIYLGDNKENITDHYAEEQSEIDGTFPVTVTVDGSKLEGLRPDPGGAGQFIYTGPIAHAIVSAEAYDYDYDEVKDLPL